MSNFVFKTDVYQRGAALMLFVVFFLIASLVLVLSVGKGVYDDLAQYRYLKAGKESFYAAESGIEDAIYRHSDGQNYSDSESFTVAGTQVATTRVTGTDSFTITAQGDAQGASRKSQVTLLVGVGISFNFGLQSGNGGILMSNNSDVWGNVYSNGSVVGQGSALVHGNIVSAGPSGLVQTIHATGSVWAHTINGAVVDRDAYYYSPATIIGTVVGGVSYPNSTDQVPIPLPIDDAQIEDWKDGIENTGTVIASTSPQCAGGTYIIDTDISIGNVKIECNVDMKKQGASTNITLTGPVWVSGNLSFSQGPSIIAAPSSGNRSVLLIADNESNRTTSSKIAVNQSTTFTSGSANSYILMISMNNSAENGGTEKAIDLAQSANGKVLVYAAHGLIDMGNSISLKEVTAYQIEISNGAQVTYETGLMSLLFDSGPGGGFTISDWQEL